MNQLNKRVILIPMLLIFTLVVATAFIKYYILYHGFRKAIISNKDTVTGRVACKQMVPKDERIDWLKKEERERI